MHYIWLLSQQFREFPQHFPRINRKYPPLRFGIAFDPFIFASTRTFELEMCFVVMELTASRCKMLCDFYSVKLNVMDPFVSKTVNVRGFQVFWWQLL